MAMKSGDPTFGYTLADTTRLLRRVFDRRAAHLGLTRAQWRALKLIDRNPGTSQAQLAEDLDLEAIAVGRVVDRLEAAGFVERRTDPKDRRRWRLYPAGDSPAVMAEIGRLANRLHAELLAGIAPEDFATTMRVLAKVKETLNEMDRERAASPEKKKEKHK
jgi:MarR family transcriptional regulator, transcriptional regulator for hemolysin